MTPWLESQSKALLEAFKVKDDCLSIWVSHQVQRELGCIQWANHWYWVEKGPPKDNDAENTNTSNIESQPIIFFNIQTVNGKRVKNDQKNEAKGRTGTAKVWSA